MWERDRDNSKEGEKRGQNIQQNILQTIQQIIKQNYSAKEWKKDKILIKCSAKY